jgi:hypothetical protein
MKHALFEWLRQALAEDVVVIYFAGHGTPESPDDPDTLFLLPVEPVEPRNHGGQKKTRMEDRG